jgi:hypothetical protein
VRFFPWVGPGVVARPWRALPALPLPGADRTWLPHPLREALAPWRQRWQRDGWGPLDGRATSRCPPPVLGKEPAAPRWCAREVPGRVRGRTRHAALPLAVLEESAGASQHRPGRRENAPPGSYAGTDAVAP